jgi:hypothetical protein
MVFTFKDKTINLTFLSRKRIVNFKLKMESGAEPRMTEPRKTEPRKTERRMTEPRMTEHRKGPNIERPNLEWDLTSKDWASNGT